MSKEAPPIPSRTRWRARGAAALLIVLSTVPLLTNDSMTSWPFTSWTLFSTIRNDQTTQYSLTIHLKNGDEEQIQLSDAGREWRHWKHEALTYIAEPDSRPKICDIWQRAAERLSPDGTPSRLTLWRSQKVIRVRDGRVEWPERSRLLLGRCEP